MAVTLLMIEADPTKGAIHRHVWHSDGSRMVGNNDTGYWPAKQCVVCRALARGGEDAEED